MNKLIGIVGLCAVLGLSGCESLQTKVNKQISQTVFAENAALHAGRFDLAQKYSDQTVKLVPAPKKATTIKPFIAKNNLTNKTQQYVTLHRRICECAGFSRRVGRIQQHCQI